MHTASGESWCSVEWMIRLEHGAGTRLPLASLAVQFLLSF